MGAIVLRPDHHVDFPSLRLNLVCTDDLHTWPDRLAPPNGFGRTLNLFFSSVDRCTAVEEPRTDSVFCRPFKLPSFLPYQRHCRPSLASVVLACILLCIASSRWAEATWTSQNTITSSFPTSGGTFGLSVYTYGDFAISGEATNGGAVSIYTMIASEWSEHARINLPTGEVGSFGFSVALEDSMAAVGAPQISQLGQELNYTDSTLSKPGNLYVYSRTDMTWILQAKLSSLQPGADEFGYSVAVGGSHLVVGAPYALGLRRKDGEGLGVTMYDESGEVTSTTVPEASFNATGSFATGAVYTYTLVNDTWISNGVLVPNLGAEGDLFGWNMDISTDGTRLVIGAPGRSVDGIKSGAAYVYMIDATGAWSLESTLVPSDAETGAWFGYSVALDVSDAVIGTKTARSAYIFHYAATGWAQDAKLVGSDTQLNDGFGASVSIYGTYIVIGAPLNLARGAAYVFELDMVYGSWVQILKITAAMPTSQLGSSVSIGSRFLLAGGPTANHNIGQVVTMTLASAVEPSADDNTSVEDAAVLIRFSGDSSSMDLLLTRKILSEAAGTGTAQTEVRIVDVTSTSTSVSSHLFGLKVLFTSSSTMSASNAARNLLAAFSEIRYRLNTAVGAISGTAESVEVTTPEAPDSSITRTKVSAVIFLILLSMAASALLIYFTMERRKKIAADQREADQADAERELKKASEMASKKAGEKRPKARRANQVLRSKRKDRSFLQAENDAAGIEFGETFFGEEDFPISPRGYDDPGTARLEYDPTESIENTTSGYDPAPLDLPDDGPRFGTMDSDLPLAAPVPDDGPRFGGMGDGPRLDDGPRLNMDDGPRLDLDDGPRLNLSDGPRIDLNDSDHSSYSSFQDKSADDGPRIALDLDDPTMANDGPRLKMSSDDGPRISLESDRTNESISEQGAHRSSMEYPYDMSIGPEFAPRVVPVLDLHSHTTSVLAKPQGKATTENVVSIPMDDGPKLDASPADDGPSISFGAPATPSSPLAAHLAHDSNDSDPDAPMTPSRQRRPANVPKLNFNI